MCRKGLAMKRSWIVFIYMIALLLLAFTPPVPVPLQPAGLLIKVHHVAAFLVLTVLTWLSLTPVARGGIAALSLAIVIAFLFGVLIEGVQSFIPYRSGQWQDLISNAIGVALGALGISVFLLGSRHRSR